MHYSVRRKYVAFLKEAHCYSTLHSSHAENKLIITYCIEHAINIAIRFDIVFSAL